MNTADQVRLHPMLDAAREAGRFMDGRTKEDLVADRMLLLALVKEIEIIGEAASRVSSETRAELPSIPWSDIVAMRNRLIHAYFEVDLSIVWATLTSNLPLLIEQIEHLFP
jgi:uncharacterized protein with HEPN domain